MKNPVEVARAASARPPGEPKEAPPVRALRVAAKLEEYGISVDRVVMGGSTYRVARDRFLTVEIPIPAGVGVAVTTVGPHASNPSTISLRLV